MNIAHFNIYDTMGGAARNSYLLFKHFGRGNDVKLFVRQRSLLKTNIVTVDPALYKALEALRGKRRAGTELRHYFFNTTNKKALFHFHNLHGRYFPLSALPALTRNIPAVWTLHDMWAFTGHCAHSFDCERWQRGCGSCPYLTVYEAIDVDTTHERLEGKKKIYDKSHFIVTVPSQWLKAKAEKSILSNKKIVLIPYGIDETVFKPTPQKIARRRLHLPAGKTIVLFAAHGGMNNEWRRGAHWERIFKRLQGDILLLSIGGYKKEKKRMGKNIHLYSIPYVYSEKEMALYYSAADVFLYPSLADNFPHVVLEAMACQLPVVTFHTGGIPEQVEHMHSGYVARYKDTADIGKGLCMALENKVVRKKFGIAGRKRIKEYFTLQRLIADYKKLYRNSIKA